ncbi:MAG: hypothetical protein M1820_009936 [Bogoriella megaspora]|nr:MAG: hypothetical protein M1820_009936 [Bogoriella megaspora]
MAPLPFHFEQIGSLLRPQEVQEARQRLFSNQAHGNIAKDAEEECKKIEQQAIGIIVSEQLQRNITPITDGEYSRTLFYDGLFESTPGFSVEHVPWTAARSEFPTAKGYIARNYKTRAVCIATSKIHFKESAYLAEWNYLKGLLPESKWAECKITIPAPTWMHMQLKPGTAWTQESGYTSEEEYFADIVEVYRQELKILYQHGLRSVQIDDPQLTYFCNEEFCRGCKNDGVEWEDLLDLYVKVYNQCLEGRPDGLHVGVHLCRGNAPKGQYFSSGSYEAIAKKLFRELKFDTFYLEYDTERAGGFEPLRWLPKEKNVVLGMITTKNAELEDMEMLKTRVEDALAVIATGQERSRDDVLKNVGVGPQCGFSSASYAVGVGMNMEKMWEKMSLARKLKESIWGDEP